jgi:hypothetical protein
LLRPARHHAPDRLHRVKSSRWRIGGASRDLRVDLQPASDRKNLAHAFLAPTRQELCALGVEQRLLHSDAHSQPARAYPLSSIGQEGVFYSERPGRQAGVVADHLLEGIQYTAHGAVPEGVDADPPPTPHGEGSNLDQVLRFPEGVPRGVGVVGIGLVECRGKGPPSMRVLSPQILR